MTTVQEAEAFMAEQLKRHAERNRARFGSERPIWPKSGECWMPLEGSEATTIVSVDWATQQVRFRTADDMQREGVYEFISTHRRMNEGDEYGCDGTG